MKIECLIRRDGGSHVTFDASDRWPAGYYHFKPESAAPDARHVANVPEELHQHRLLGMPDVYRVVPTGKQAAPSPASGSVIVPPKQPGSGDPPAATTPPAQSDPPAPPAGVSPERIAEIRELTIKELKGKVNTFTADELRAALDAEKSRADETPRKGWLDVIEAHLGAAG